MRLYTVLLYFLQTSLHVSDDTLIHHQEQHSNCNDNICHWSKRICYRLLTLRSRNIRSDSSTSADGSKYGSISDRCCNYS